MDMLIIAQSIPLTVQNEISQVASLFEKFWKLTPWGKPAKQ